MNIGAHFRSFWTPLSTQTLYNWYLLRSINLLYFGRRHCRNLFIRFDSFFDMTMAFSTEVNFCRLIRNFRLTPYVWAKGFDCQSFSVYIYSIVLNKTGRKMCSDILPTIQNRSWEYFIAHRISVYFFPLTTNFRS